MKIKSNHREPVEKQSPNLKTEQLLRLKEIFPEIFTEDDKIDPDKFQGMFGDFSDDRPERYSFSWAGKRDSIRLLQTPTRGTLVPCRDESVDFDTTQNLFIEGENLEVMKLLYKAYFGRVKMIYIDPPYNTGNDFIYPDDYKDPLDTYLKMSGQKDEEGNLLTSKTETSGRLHSSWLSMMYPRLFLARQLLRDDGIIFVSIDDNEVHNLRMLMNEVFGEENFIDSIIWKKRYGGGAKEKYLVTIHEYILMYSKNRAFLGNLFVPLSEESIARYYKYKDDNFERRGPFRTHPLESMKSFGERKNLVFPIPAPDGSLVMPKRQWRWSPQHVNQAIEAGELYFAKDKNGEWTVHSKQYLRDDNGTRETKFFSIIDDVYTQHGTNEIIDVFGDAQVFGFPKPSKLIFKLIQLITEVNDNDIVLDFFSGSGPTAQAMLELNAQDGGNRKFILVQFPELTGRKDYPCISDICKERIRRIISKMKEQKKEAYTGDLGFKSFKLAESNFKSWSGVKEPTPQDYISQMEVLIDPLKKGWKAEDIIFEVAIKEGYAPTSLIEHVKTVKANTVYKVINPEDTQFFYICFDKLVQLEALQVLELKKEDLFVCRDIALSDETAANLALQCRLKTI